MLWKIIIVINKDVLFRMKKETIMKNWSIEKGDSGLFMPPEMPQIKYRLYGKEYGRYDNFNGGYEMHTNTIRNIIDCGEYKIVDTGGDYIYRVYPNDINPSYENQYKNAFRRLKIDNESNWGTVDYLISIGYSEEVSNKLIKIIDDFNTPLYEYMEIFKMGFSELLDVIKKIHELEC